MEQLTNVLTLLFAPVLRSVFGWLQHSIKDGKIDKFEMEKLYETTARVGFISFCTFFGLEGMGFDVTAIGAVFGSIVADKVIEALKENKKE